MKDCGIFETRNDRPPSKGDFRGCIL